MTSHYLGIDVHKTESQIAVLDSTGELEKEVRVRNANLEEVAQRYAGSKAAIEAGSNYFTIYDTLSEHLDVTLVNPSKAPWLNDEKQKDDRRDAKKLARFLRMDELPESYVPPKELRKYRALARGRKKLKEKQSDFKNEVQSLLDQHGITRKGSLWSQEGREFLAELTLGEPWQSVMEQWLEAIDEFETKINRLQDKIEEVARELEELDFLTSVPGIAAYSGLMIHSEIGEIERFDRASELVSYAGLDPVVRESGDSRTEGGISKEGNGYLRWILVQCAHTAVHNVKDPYLRDFYERLRHKRKKPKKVAIVATARKLLVSIFHMLKDEEVYDPAV